MEPGDERPPKTALGVRGHERQKLQALDDETQKERKRKKPEELPGREKKKKRQLEAAVDEKRKKLEALGHERRRRGRKLDAVEAGKSPSVVAGGKDFWTAGHG